MPKCCGLPYKGHALGLQKDELMHPFHFGLCLMAPLKLKVQGMGPKKGGPDIIGGRGLTCSVLAVYHAKLRNTELSKVRVWTSYIVVCVSELPLCLKNKDLGQK